jgi:hypothetical protein
MPDRDSDTLLRRSVASRRTVRRSSVSRRGLSNGMRACCRYCRSSVFDLRRIAQHARGNVVRPAFGEQPMQGAVELRALRQHVAAQSVQRMKLQVLQVSAER